MPRTPIGQKGRRVEEEEEEDPSGLSTRKIAQKQRQENNKVALLFPAWEVKGLPPPRPPPPRPPFPHIGHPISRVEGERGGRGTGN